MRDELEVRIEKLEKRCQWLTYKAEDGENRSCRYNVRIRGIPESVSNQDLQQYVQDLCKSLLHSSDDNLIELDLTHRVFSQNQFQTKRRTDESG